MVILSGVLGPLAELSSALFDRYNCDMLKPMTDKNSEINTPTSGSKYQELKHSEAENRKITVLGRMTDRFRILPND